MEKILMETKTYKEIRKEGYNFHFDVDGHHIHSYGSSMSGKEIVYVDGEVVNERRSFRKRSQIEFYLGNNKYEIEYNMISLLTGELHCTLIKNGVHVETQICKLEDLKEQNPKAFWRGFITWFIIGAISGFVGMSLLIYFFDL